MKRLTGSKKRGQKMSESITAIFSMGWLAGVITTLVSIGLVKSVCLGHNRECCGMDGNNKKRRERKNENDSDA